MEDKPNPRFVRKNIKYKKIQIVKREKMWNYGVDLAEPRYTRNEAVILINKDDESDPDVVSNRSKWVYDSGPYMINLDTCEFYYRLYATDHDTTADVYYKKINYADKMEHELGLIDPRQWVRERHQGWLNDEYDIIVV